MERETGITNDTFDILEKKMELTLNDKSKFTNETIKKKIMEDLVIARKTFNNYKSNIIIIGQKNNGKTTIINKILNYYKTKFTSNLDNNKVKVEVNPNENTGSQTNKHEVKILTESHTENTGLITTIEKGLQNKISTIYTEKLVVSDGQLITKDNLKVRDFEYEEDLRDYINNLNIENSKVLEKLNHDQTTWELNSLIIYLPYIPDKIRIIDTPGTSSISCTKGILNRLKDKTSLNIVLTLQTWGQTTFTDNYYVEILKSIREDFPDSLFYFAVTKIDLIFRFQKDYKNYENFYKRTEFENDEDRKKCFEDNIDAHMKIFNFYRHQFVSETNSILKVFLLTTQYPKTYDSFLNHINSFIEQYAYDISMNKIKLFVLPNLNEVANKYNKNLIIEDFDKLEKSVKRALETSKELVEARIDKIANCKNTEDLKSKCPKLEKDLKSNFDYNDKNLIKSRKIIRSHYIEDQIKFMSTEFNLLVNKMMKEVLEKLFEEIYNNFTENEKKRIIEYLESLYGNEVSTMGASEIVGLLGVTLTAGGTIVLRYGVFSAATLAAEFAGLAMTTWIPVIGWAVGGVFGMIFLSNFIGAWKIEKTYPDCIEAMLKEFEKSHQDLKKSTCKNIEDITNNLLSLLKHQKHYDENFKDLLRIIGNIKVTEIPKNEKFEVILKKEFNSQLDEIIEANKNNTSKANILKDLNSDDIKEIKNLINDVI